MDAASTSPQTALKLQLVDANKKLSAAGRDVTIATVRGVGYRMLAEGR